MWIVILNLLRGAVGWLSKLPVYVWIIAILAVSNLVSFSQWQHNAKMFTQEKASHTLDIKNFKDAQAKADADAKAMAQALIKESKANAREADANYTILLSKYNASLLRYHTSQSHSSQANSYQPPSPQGGDRPSGGPQLSEAITITLDDAQICAVNTARLQAVHDWAVALPR